MADTPVTPALLRGDIQSMLTYIQGARIVSMARETMISQLQGWLIYRFWAGVLLFAIVGSVVVLLGAAEVLVATQVALLCGLLVLMLASRAGAIVSIGRRMNTDGFGPGPGGDSIFTLAALGSGRNGLALALLSANAFGLVMYAVLASGLPAVIGFSGGIVPRFVAVEEAQLVERARDYDRRAAELEGQARECRTQPATATSPVKAASSPTPRTQPLAEPATDAAGNETTPAVPAPADGSENDAAPAVDNSAAAAAAPSPSPAAATAPVSCDDLAAAAKAVRALATGARLALAATPAPPRAATSWIEAVRDALGLSTTPDLFKLILWAFIAGFCEQFVPDMLNTVSARASEAMKRENAAGK